MPPLTRCLAAVLLLILSVLPAAADPPAQKPALSAKEMAQALERLGRVSKDAVPDEGRLGQAIKEASLLRTQANACAQSGQTDVARLTEAAAAVGEPIQGESRDLTVQRKSLLQDKVRAEAQLAECRLVVVQADETIARLTDLQQRVMTERLALREADFFRLVLFNLQNPTVGVGALAGYAAGGAGLEAVTPRRGAELLALALIGLGLGMWLRRLVVVVPPAVDAPFSGRLAKGLLAGLAGAASPLMVVMAVAFGMAVTSPDPAAPTFLEEAVYGAAITVAVLTVIRALLAPRPPMRQITPLSDLLARAMARRLVVLAPTVLLGALLLFTDLAVALPEPVFLLGRGVLVAVLVLNLAWLIWLLGRVPGLGRTGHSLQVALLAGLAVILTAEALGYRNLSGYLLLGLLQSGLIGAAFWLAQTLVNDLLDGLDRTRPGFTGALRRRLGLGEDEPFPGLLWLRLLATLVLWGGVALLVLRAWGMSDASMALLIGYLMDGFTLGELSIVPSKVLGGVFVFAVLLTISRWLRDWAEHKWFARSRMDRGAREAMVTIVGYAGFVVAVLAGLSTAGVAFTNLAIIASALSVGIGFGLQNVVSNFVAGIILLFERPIKTGDWVVVGDTEGYVKKIRVRATEIQTFDRSDVTIPNSDFITSHVTNWTLRDRHGRGKVPLGVAYGSDTQLVKRILLDIAEAHSGVMKAPGLLPPTVLFMGFGDSALLFELRFMVRNVDDRLSVISDINFAIDAAFREHGIEIPFPQRVVHVHGGEGSAAAGLAAREAAEAEV